MVTKDGVRVRVFHFKATIPSGHRKSTQSAFERKADLVTQLSCESLNCVTGPGARRKNAYVV